MDKNMEYNRDWLKGLLNNLTLLRFIKKHTADNILEDNKMANDKFNITTSDESISVLDKTATKMLITKSDFEGEVFTSFNMKQLTELIDTIGNVEGELMIPLKSDMKEMIVKLKDNSVVVVCPLPSKEKVTKKKK